MIYRGIQYPSNSAQAIAPSSALAGKYRGTDLTLGLSHQTASSGFAVALRYRGIQYLSTQA